MNPAGGDPVPDLTGLVARWSGALRGTCYVPLTADERERLLHGLAARMLAAVRAEPFDAVPGYWVGTELLDAGFTAPEALCRTLAVLGGWLPTVSGAAGGTRALELTAALAAGFAAAVHERTLDAQDASQRAILTAKDRAERALRDSEARFRYVATHDPLTTLPNRTRFNERLVELLDRADGGSRLGLCCVDLDGFAAVNDSLGRDVGDRLLTAVAERLCSVAAGDGRLVARLEGDQFAILIADTSGAEDVIKAADRALAAIGAPFHAGGLELPLTASAGIVERPAAGTTAAELCRAAEVALHWAKADGRGLWRLYEQARADRDAVRYRLSAALPYALRERQFALAYQPLVDLATGALAGVEALARWRHPRYGLLGADRFIGLAQDTGLIVALGAQLLRQACEQAVAWPGGTEMPLVSVNLAEHQLRYPGLVADVAQVLDGTGLAPERLQLEITEHAVIGTGPETVGVLRRLVGLGVRVALDDFGTGYANLACLRALPLHAVKLDASVVRPAADGAANEFLATVVSLGHTLGLTVTAEGIETATQAERLRAAGCDTGQGWHFGRPTSPRLVARRYGGGG